MRLPASTKHTKRSKYPLEAAEQRTAWDYLATVGVPSPDGIRYGGVRLQDYSYMVPNGTQLAGTGKRRAIQMANLKAQGLVPGISDIVIAYPTHGYHGAYIEMKRVRGAYAGPAAIKAAVRPAQIQWLMRTASVGYWVAVSYGAEEFIRHVEMYLRGDPNSMAFGGSFS